MTTTPAPSSHFGALLKHYRWAAGLTQGALAEQARLSVRGIQDLERGVSQAPRPDTVELLGAALEISAEERAELVAAARPPLAPAQPAPSVPVSPSAVVPLVGRRREQALLQQFLAGASELGQTAPLLVLAGEPGIGKTRLREPAVLVTVSRRAAGDEC